MATDVEILRAAIEGFEIQKQRLADRIYELRQKLNPQAMPANVTEIPKKRIVSAASRKKMALAQKRRWAAIKKMSATA